MNKAIYLFEPFLYYTEELKSERWPIQIYW